MSENRIEIAPGVVISKPQELPHDAEQALQRGIERTMNEEITVEQRKKNLLDRVRKLLNLGEPLQITEEMEELGLVNDCRAMAMEADMYYRLNRMLRSEDDDGFEASVDSLYD